MRVLESLDTNLKMGKVNFLVIKIAVFWNETPCTCFSMIIKMDITT